MLSYKPEISTQEHCFNFLPNYTSENRSRGSDIDSPQSGLFLFLFVSHAITTRPKKELQRYGLLPPKGKRALNGPLCYIVASLDPTLRKKPDNEEEQTDLLLRTSRFFSRGTANSRETDHTPRKNNEFLRHTDNVQWTFFFERRKIVSLPNLMARLLTDDKKVLVNDRSRHDARYKKKFLPHCNCKWYN